MGKILKSFIIDYLLASLVFVLLGVLFLVSPETSGKIICYIFAGFLCLLGIFRIVEYLLSPVTLYKYSLGLVVGLILIGCGIFVFAKPQTIISVLPTVLGVVLLLDGLIKLQNAADMMKIHDKSWRYALIMCIVSAILGGLMLANPFKASEMLLKFIGSALIFNGVMDAIALLVLYNHVNKKEKKKMPDAAKDNQA